MTRNMGPNGNDFFEYDTVGGVPVFTHISIASRICTPKGKRLERPGYGTDFSWCARQDDPWDAVCSEASRALGADFQWDMVCTQDVDANAVDVEMSGRTESGDNWSLTFRVNLTDGTVVDFPPFVVDGRLFQ